MNGRTPSSPLAGTRRLIDVRVPMRDGVTLSIDLYLPPGDGPFPTVLVRTPYDNGNDSYLQQVRPFVRDGWAFAVQDCRGRFDSGGEWYAWGSEVEDGADTHAWLGAQPWRAGIGTIGSSSTSARASSARATATPSRIRF